MNRSLQLGLVIGKRRRAQDLEYVRTSASDPHIKRMTPWGAAREDTPQ